MGTPQRIFWLAGTILLNELLSNPNAEPDELARVTGDVLSMLESPIRDQVARNAERENVELRKEVRQLKEYANRVIDVVEVQDEIAKTQDDAVKAQSVEFARREVVIRGAQYVIAELVKLCKVNNVAIPDELTGGTVQ